MCSRPVEWAKYGIKGSQKTALAKKNDAKEYTRLYRLFFDEFPEYKEEMLKRIEEYENPNKAIVITKEEKQEYPSVICQLSGRLGNILFKMATANYYAA